MVAADAAPPPIRSGGKAQQTLTLGIRRVGGVDHVQGKLN